MTRRFACLAVLLLAAAAAAQPQPRPAPGRFEIDRPSVERSPGFALFLDPVAAAELGLTDAQKAALKAVPDDVIARHKDAIAAAREADQKAAEKAAAEEPARVKETDGKVAAVLAKHLTEAQRQRGRQLYLQSAGMLAFQNEAVAAALKLTDAQQTDARKAASVLQGEMLKLRGGEVLGQPATDAGRAARRDAARKAVDGFVKTLSPDQAKAWAGLVGAPSDKVTVTSQTSRAPSPAGWGTSRLPTSGETRLWMTLGRPTPFVAPWWDELGLGDEKVAAVQGEIQAAVLGSRVTTPAASATALTRVRVTDAAAAAAEKVLTAPQSARLAQVRHQLTGLDALGAPAVLKELKFTPAQDAAVGAALAAAERAAGPAPADDPAGFTGGSEATRAARLARQAADVAAVRAVLTADQKRVADRVYGDPVPLAKVGPAARGFGLSTPWYAGPWSPAGAWARAAPGLAAAGEYADARAAYDESLRLKADDPAVQSRLARLLATCPDDTVRDGKRAVGLAEAVHNKPESGTALLLDTLAAAYAEAGRFDDAVKAQEQAVALLKMARATGPGGFAPPPAAARHVSQYEDRLKLYRDKKPFREPPPAKR